MAIALHEEECLALARLLGNHLVSDLAAPPGPLDHLVDRLCAWAERQGHTLTPMQVTPGNSAHYGDRVTFRLASLDRGR